MPNPYAVCSVIKGGTAVLVNSSTREGFDAERNTCPKCRITEYKSGDIRPVCYANKRHAGTCCDECHDDQIAMMAIELERAGINLGWGYHKSDSDSAEYLRERHGYTAGPVRLQSDAKEV